MRTSLGRFKYIPGILLLNFILLSPSFLIGQTSVLKQQVSVSMTGRSIADVLETLSNTTGVRFTYDPDDISSGRIISVDVKNMPLGEVLSKVLDDNSIVFHEKGGQIIIFRDRSARETTLQNATAEKLNAGKIQKNSDSKKIATGERQSGITPLKTATEKAGNDRPDTLYIIRRDTIQKIDTLIRTDTLIFHDTVFITKDKVTGDVQPVKKDHGLFLEISGSYLVNKMILSAAESENDILAEKLESTGIRNLSGYSAGIGLGYRKKGWAIRSGLNYTRFHQLFKYSYEHQTGGYFETDTIEKYYTLTGIDTTWFYITDSTWLEKQVQHYNYKEQNRFSYIEIPLNVTYSFYQRKFDLYLSGGVIAGILPSATGSFIDPEPDYPSNNLGDLSLKTFIISATAGAGARFSFNTHAGLLTEVAYRQQLSSVFKNYPVSSKFSSISFRLGLTFDF